MDFARSSPCVICSRPGTLYCVFCEQSFFCEEHACGHIVRSSVPVAPKRNGFKANLGILFVFIGVIVTISAFEEHPAAGIMIALVVLVGFAMVSQKEDKK